VRFRAQLEEGCSDGVAVQRMPGKTVSMSQGSKTGPEGARQQNCIQEPKTSVGVRAHKGVKGQGKQTPSRQNQGIEARDRASRQGLLGGRVAGPRSIYSWFGNGDGACDRFVRPLEEARKSLALWWWWWLASEAENLNVCDNNRDARQGQAPMSNWQGPWRWQQRCLSGRTASDWTARGEEGRRARGT
jgi:hypothetical protein